MAQKAIWYNTEKTILHQLFYDKADVNDYHQNVKDSLELISTVNHTVHLIMDLRNAQVDDKGMISALSKAEKTVPTNQGCVVVLGGKAYHKVLVNVGKVVAPKAVENVHFLDTMEQALEVISKQQAQEEPQTKP